MLHDSFSHKLQCAVITTTCASHFLQACFTWRLQDDFILIKLNHLYVDNCCKDLSHICITRQEKVKKSFQHFSFYKWQGTWRFKWLKQWNYNYIFLTFVPHKKPKKLPIKSQTKYQVFILLMYQEIMLLFKTESSAPQH